MEANAWLNRPSHFRRPKVFITSSTKLIQASLGTCGLKTKTRKIFEADSFIFGFFVTRKVYSRVAFSTSAIERFLSECCANYFLIYSDHGELGHAYLRNSRQTLKAPNLRSKAPECSQVFGVEGTPDRPLQGKSRIRFSFN